MKRCPVNMMLLLLGLFLLSVQAARGVDFEYRPDGRYPGRYPDTAIPVNGFGTGAEITDSVDTYAWSLHKFRPETVHYDLFVPEAAEVIITTHGSKLRHTAIRVRKISTDTIDFPSHPTSDRYTQVLRDADAWDTAVCDTSQASFYGRLIPGTYRVEVHGVYTQDEGTSNGMIATTFIGLDKKGGISRAIPRFLRFGMRSKPIFLNTMPADFNYDIYTEKQLTAPFLDARDDFDGNVYYEFGVADTLDITLTTAGYGTRLLVMPKDSLGGDTLICRAESRVMRRMPPGRYLIAAADTLSMTEGAVIGFLVESAPPPPPPYWHKYVRFNPSVASANSITTRTMLSSDGSEYDETVSYCDGLGRPTLTLSSGASPEGGDIARLTQYDMTGRQWRQWLPGISAGGYVLPSAIDYSAAYPGETAPYAETRYDGTPFDRPGMEYGPGAAWRASESAVSHTYMLNGSGTAHSVMRYTVSDTPDEAALTVRSQGRYGNHELTVHELTDEDGRRHLEFSDIRGRMLLDRADMADGTFADTYYIYDTYGNLTVVLSPEASDRMAYTGGVWNAETAEELCLWAYVYHYDRRGRMTSKRLPGGERTEYAYDATDRCVLWRDGALRGHGLWHFDIADAFGRPCLSGICSGLSYASGSAGTARAVRTAGGDPALMGYAVPDVTVTDAQVLTATYYDDYSFLGQYGFPADDRLGFETAADYGDRYGNVRGQMTGTATALPTEAGADTLTYVYSAVYYDSRDHVVQSVATNHLGGTDRTLTAYDFGGRAVRTEARHTSAPAADTAQIVQQWERTYDRQSRLLTERHRMGRTGDWMTLTENVYDAVGRLRAESFGTAITREYAYDVRSRITKITSGYYRQTLGYTPGGNVAAMSWWAFGPYETERKYVYTYDALSRLTSARYTDGDGMAGLFDTEYAYDLNGNINRLWRNGVYDRTPRGIQYGPIDDLTLEYDGNRLVRVADACAGPFYQGAYHFADGADEAVEYTYDAAGNTVSDLNRGITAMVYDDNSRPRRVEFADGSQTLYLYDASGLKRRTVHRVASLPVTQPGAEDASAPTEFVESVTDYCGGIVYEDSVLTRINLAGGYLRIADNSGNKLAKPEYHFYHRDHLGNNRMDLDGTTGGVHQITHYYPYGMPMDCGYIQGYQRWLFGDKEFDRTSGLDLYDFEARAYDPALGRFRQPDPLAESYRPLSPYLYCAANPLANVDPTGESTYVVNGDDGQYSVIYGKLNEDKNIYLCEQKGDKIIVKSCIGETTSVTSFYNSDTGRWGGTINPNDQSGEIFMNSIIADTPQLDNYVLNAGNGEKYDFKETNAGLPKVSGDDIYRGMPFGINSEGKQVYTSARDIGNIVAGYVAGYNGLTWTGARLGFDGYQSITNGKLSIEGPSTQNAQMVGFKLGERNGRQPNAKKKPSIIISLMKSLPFFKSLLK